MGDSCRVGEGRGRDEVREMGEADNEGLEGHAGTLAFPLREMEGPWQLRTGVVTW